MKWDRSAFRAVVVAVLCAVLVLAGCSRGPEAEKVAVAPGQQTTGSSADGGVTVEIPGTSVDTSGELRITPASTPDGRAGWSIDLDGAELTAPVTLRFPIGELEPGEPIPVVTYADAPDGEPTPATDVRYENGQVVVTTDHFSHWVVQRWKDIADAATQWLGARFDDLASLGHGSPPSCPGEYDVRKAGFDATSDQGKRVYWCLGQDERSPLLKVVNARGYGVAVEYTPGFEVAATDRKDWIGWAAELLRPAPSLKSNRVELLPPGSEIEFDLIGSRGTDGVMVKPHPASYLLTALDFGVGTYAMAIERVGGRAAADKFLAAMEGATCLSSFSRMASSSDLDDMDELTQFFAAALNMALDCAAPALEDADLGPLLSVVVAPLLWVVNGVRTAIDGFVGAFERIDGDGYQIIVTRPVPDTEILEVTPVDRSGDPLPGWNPRDTSRMEVDCRYPRSGPYPSMSSLGTDIVECGSTAQVAHTCWIHPDRTTLTCAVDVWERTYTPYRVAEALPTVPPADDPQPEWIELEDGAHCFLRHGGAWGARSDGLTGAYACRDRDYVVLTDDVHAVDTSSNQWTVMVGEMGSPTEDFPPPTVMGVVRAYFAASP